MKRLLICLFMLCQPCLRRSLPIYRCTARSPARGALHAVFSDLERPFGADKEAFVEDAPLPKASELRGFVSGAEMEAAKVLDLPSVLEALSKRAVTSGAKQALLSSALKSELSEIQSGYAALEELQGLPEALPLSVDMDFSAALERAKRLPSVEVEDLVAVERGSAAVMELRRFLMRSMDEKAVIPLLQAMASPIEVPEELKEGLKGAFDDEGNLDGNKFPEIGRLRKRISATTASIDAKLKQLLADDSFTSQLSDTTVNKINGRFVVAVPPSQKRRVGIVHDVSRSGKTVYVEPEALIQPTNELSELRATLRGEESRVLSQLTLLVKMHVPVLERSMEAALELDMLQAKLSLGNVWSGSLPEVRQEGVINVVAAKHAVLIINALTKQEAQRRQAVTSGDLGVADTKADAASSVVGNDLFFDATGTHAPQALLISGPNAGGKTIVLKTMGLLAMLVRLGLPLPVHHDATANLRSQAAKEASDALSRRPRVDLFTPIMAAIGDEQSVTEGVSTFQAHCLTLEKMIHGARPGALLLCDEIGSGTDPGQGSALAQAVVENCIEAGALVGVTTHYSRLKDFAASDKEKRFAMGAMLLGDDGRPTYRMRIPSVGDSYGLETADRVMGHSDVGARILGRARDLLGTQERQLSEMLLAAEKQRAELDKIEIDIQKKYEEAERRVKDAEAKARVAEEQLRAAQRDGRREWANEVKKKERQLEELLQQIKSSPSPNVEVVGESLKELRAVRREVDEEAFKLEDRPEFTPLGEMQSLEEGKEYVVTTPGPWAGRIGKAQKIRRRKKGGKPVEKAELEFGVGIIAEFSREELGLPVASARREKNTRKTPFTGGSGKLSKTVQEDLEMDKIRRKKQAVSPSGAGDVRRTSVGGPTLRLAGNTCDVRGLTLHEAQTKVDYFLDKCVSTGFNCAFVLHGHGTGVLKKGIREWIRNANHVASAKPASNADGGDAFTEVQLK